MIPANALKTQTRASLTHPYYTILLRRGQEKAPARMERRHSVMDFFSGAYLFREACLPTQQSCMPEGVVSIMDGIVSIHEELRQIVWGWPMMLLILGAGVYFTLGTRFLQFRKFGRIMAGTIGKMFDQTAVEDKGAVSPFQAMTTALAATVGTGNIAGVAGAIAMGGPGAVFWMWISALLGMCTKYAEVVLSIQYRERNAQGEWVGGPMYTIQNGLGPRWKWLAVTFAVLGMTAAFGIGNMTQINTIAGSVNMAIAFFVPGAANFRNAINAVIGLLVAALAAMALFGGVKRIGRVTEKLVPLMSGLYIFGCLVVIFVNISRVGAVFVAIFRAAFQPASLLGGATGIGIISAMKRGVSRGVFSNEAGLGSAPIAYAAASTESPVEQGFYGIFEVFADTIVICTLTALAILTSGVIGVSETAAFAYGDDSLGINMSIAAFGTVFGNGMAGIIISIASTLFALATILSWSLYGARCFEYIFGVKHTRVYQMLFVAFIMVGATMKLSLAWSIADTLNGLMALPNLCAILALSGTVFRLTATYRNGILCSKCVCHRSTALAEQKPSGFSAKTEINGNHGIKLP